jgi:hypothetical protein
MTVPEVTGTLKYIMRFVEPLVSFEEEVKSITAIGP